MSHKTKGVNAERELVHLFWKNNWAAIRVAGSGSAKYPSPDILAANISRKLAIESKLTKEDKKYFKKEDILQLTEFAEKFGAEPWIAIKFKGNPWFFLSLEDLQQTGANYSIPLELAKRRGLVFSELIESK